MLTWKLLGELHLLVWWRVSHWFIWILSSWIQYPFQGVANCVANDMGRSGGRCHYIEIRQRWTVICCFFSSSVGHFPHVNNWSRMPCVLPRFQQCHWFIAMASSIGTASPLLKNSGGLGRKLHHLVEIVPMYSFFLRAPYIHWLCCELWVVPINFHLMFDLYRYIVYIYTYIYTVHIKIYGGAQLPDIIMCKKTQTEFIDVNP